MEVCVASSSSLPNTPKLLLILTLWNFIGETKAPHILWLDQLEKLEEGRLEKKAYQGRSVGRRPVGRRYR